MSLPLLSGRKRASDEPEPAASASDGRAGSRLRRTLVGLGALVVGYAVARRMRSGSGGAAVDSLPESASDAGPGDVRPGEGRQSFSDSEAVAVDVEGVGESAGEDDELPGEDRTAAEMAELAEEDARKEPAEPGEMEVDEELVEGVVDEGGGDGTGETDESQTNESEAEENEADETGGDENEADGS